MSEAQQDSTQTTEEERNSLQQGIDWVAKHWPRVRLGHEGFMLDKIQRQQRITEQLAKNTMTGDFQDDSEWPEDDDMGVNIGDHIHYHQEQPAPQPVPVQAPQPTPAPSAPSLASKVAPYLIGASVIGGPVAGYALSQMFTQDGARTTIVQDPTVDTYTDVEAVQIYKPGG